MSTQHPQVTIPDTEIDSLRFDRLDHSSVDRALRRGNLPRTLLLAGAARNTKILGSRGTRRLTGRNPVGQCAS